jgi:hypothetical protein
MSQRLFRNPLLSAALLLAPGLAQAPKQSDTLVVNGYSGQAPVIQVKNGSYVEVASLARLTGGSIKFQANQIILTLPPSVEKASPPQSGFSQGFLRAGIEEMTVIREWRIAIVNAIQNNYAVMEDWVAGYRRTADSKSALASAAAVTEADKNGLSLLRNEFNNMQAFSDKYLELHKTLTYTSPDSLDNDPLNQQVLNCARGLASMAAGGQFQDVPECH